MAFTEERFVPSMKKDFIIALSKDRSAVRGTDYPMAGDIQIEAVRSLVKDEIKGSPTGGDWSMRPLPIEIQAK